MGFSKCPNKTGGVANNNRGEDGGTRSLKTISYLSFVLEHSNSYPGPQDIGSVVLRNPKLGMVKFWPGFDGRNGAGKLNRQENDEREVSTGHSR